MKVKGLKFGVLCLGLALSAMTVCADLTTLTNGSGWGEFRTNINNNTLQTNTNTWNIVTNATGVAVNNTAVTNLTSEITVATGLVSINSDGGATDFVFGSTQLADTLNPVHDSRMWFDKSKGAFRAGHVSGTQWDDANVGSKSMAVGLNTTASGDYSFCAGSLTIASGDYSFSGGFSTTGSGNNSMVLGNLSESSGAGSFAAGYSTTASGIYSMALGSATTASGAYSFSGGYNTTAGSYAGTAVGRYNVGGGTAGSWVSTDPLFEVGMGASSGSTSNAFTVYKNGNAAVAGIFTLGGDPSADLDAMNKGYADATYAPITAPTAVSNAFIAADTVISNDFIAADTVVSNALVVQIAAIDGVSAADLTVVSNAFVAADATQPTLWETYATTADNAVRSSFASADSIVSAAYIAADVVVTADYIAADTVVSNALAGASATVPVSPFGLVSAWTFDGAVTNDWWGTNMFTNSDGLTNGFDSVVGGYLENTLGTDNPLWVDISLTNDFTYVFAARTSDTGSPYVFNHYSAGFVGAYATRDTNLNKWNFVYNDGVSSDTIAYGDGGSSETWHHFAFVYNSTDLEVYLYHNGALTDQSTGATLDPIGWTGTLRLAHSASTDTFDVDFGYFYLFERALSSNEVVRLHALDIVGQYGVQGLRRP